MVDEVDSRISPAMDPYNVRNLEEYDDETAPVLGHVENAFRRAYEALRDVHNARDAARMNPTWTEGQQVIHTDALARKHLDKITRTFDRANDDLKNGIAHIEAELRSPVVTKASLQIAQEIRAHCKTLPKGSDRLEFLNKLLKDGDSLSLSAVLGGPAFLSGLTNDQVELYTWEFHTQAEPAKAKRLSAMRSALALLHRNAPLVFKEMNKAIGCPPQKLRALKTANTAAEKAMVVREVV